MVMRSVKVEEKIYKRLKLESARTGKKIYEILTELYKDRDSNKTLNTAYNNLLAAHQKLKGDLEVLKKYKE